ncbi:hypothetical protein WH52_01915 [Tenacibaculum holothuriorum]|uniref:Signal transduction histidine kinase internal region domain-containing protein n=2 Tax=Tenacibaculum holothuriorum TaxID=1635173 RepID=A0A1Y2PG09_9FLAO|nr:hypothetical protein WH52_01915 [Tenacibaculum holothuriorum]
MKKHLLIILIGAILGLSLGYYILISDQELAAIEIMSLILSALGGILIAYVSYFLSIQLDRLLPWKNQVGNRLFVGIIAHFVLISLLTFSAVKLYNSIIFNTEDVFNSYESSFIKLAILVFLICILFQVIYFALYSYYSYATLQIETVKQERKQIELQLNALKSQLSPHFLFNGLNTISSLVYKNEQKAKLFIRKLATMYDYTLKSYDTKLITLQEELAFVNSYIFLVETRFENKFHCTIMIPEELLETKIPPLTLQMLIENAVKHNVLSDENLLEVRITVDGKHIKVHNNITSVAKKVSSFKIGLKNINSRYLLLYGEGIITTNGNDFTVKIPIIV